MGDRDVGTPGEGERKRLYRQGGWNVDLYNYITNQFIIIKYTYLRILAFTNTDIFKYVYL